MTHQDRMAAFEAERKLITIEEQQKGLKIKIELLEKEKEIFEKEKEIFKVEKEKYIEDMEILNKFLIDNNLTINNGKVCSIGTLEENKDFEHKNEGTSEENTATLPEDIDSFTKKELLEYCKANSIEINETLTKDEILKYLKLEK